MTPAHTALGARRYRYYTCTAAQKRGWQSCPSKSLPAAAIEALVVEQVQAVGRDPAVVRRLWAEARAQDAARTAELEAEGGSLEQDHQRWQGELDQLAGRLRPGEDNGSLIGRLAELQERVATVVGRVRKVREQTQAVQQGLVDEDQVASALALFEPCWPTLAPREQARVLALVVQRMEYDGTRQKMAITFHLRGLQALAADLADRQKERRA
jgi:site-specific DNA recombinase